MRIVYGASRPENIGGGETKVAFDMAREMAKNHEVLIVHPSMHDETLVEKEGNFIRYGIRSVERGNVYTPKLDPGEVRKLKNYLDRFNPDVVHSHTLVWMGQILQDWAIKNGKPFFYTTHILPSRAAEWTDLDSAKSAVKKFTDSGLFKDYISSFYNSCSVIITLNEESEGDLREFGYNGKSYVIPNGTQLSQFMKIDIADINEANINLIFTGNISKRKRQMFLVESMVGMPSNYHLYLAGDVDVDGSYMEKVKSYIHKHKLKNVHMLGKIPFSEIPSTIEKCHYFVSASSAEVQSLAIIEALASGRPIIAIENQTTRELVSEENGLLLSASTTPSEFAEAVQQLHSRKNQYTQLSSNARELAQMFDYDEIIKRTVKVYTDHIGDAPKKNSKATSKIFAATFIAGTFGLYLAMKALKKAKRK